MIGSTKFWLKICQLARKGERFLQGRKRNIFQRGQSHFSWFFPGVKCFFPIENSHFGTPTTNFSGFEKWKKKTSSFCNFSSFHFQFSTFPFSISFFSSPFPLFFFLPLFPGRSAEISRWKVSGKHLPPASGCYATGLLSILPFYPFTFSIGAKDRWYRAKISKCWNLEAYVDV